MKSLLYWSFLVLICLLLVHVPASIFYWYWTSPYLDKVVHTLAGLSVGLFGVWVWWRSGLFGKSIPNPKEAFLTAFLIVLFVGVAWEVFEFVYGVANPAVGMTYGQDTFLDVCSDLLGATIAGLLARRAEFYL